MSEAVNVAFDPAELDRYLSREPGDVVAVIRFALHVQARDPTNVRAPLTLASHSECPMERAYALDDAVRAGERFWAPNIARGEVRWWDDAETRLYMKALYASGALHAELGHLDVTADRVKRLLGLDPQDRIGAEDLARRTGVIPEVEAQRAPSMRM